MTTNRILTGKQFSQFLREGYVIVPGVYSVTDIQYARQFFQVAFDNKLWRSAPYSSPEIINDIYRLFPELSDIIFNQKYIETLLDLLGEPLICLPECSVHHNRFFDWHRDTTAMEATGETVHLNTNNSLLIACTYFQDNEAEGGGLTIIPESHIRNDRFVKMYHGGYHDRLYYKFLKMMRQSPFQEIDLNEQHFDIPSKVGDLVIFNLQLDHRATFIRDKNGNPKIYPKEKFAVFNTFSQPGKLARIYLEHQKTRNEPYYHYLRKTALADQLFRKGKELGFEIYQ